WMSFNNTHNMTYTKEKTHPFFSIHEISKYNNNMDHPKILKQYLKCSDLGKKYGKRKMFYIYLFI
ncbi:MAG: hypothetical protein QXM66_05170, partial [Nitrososphaerota archaeon]